MLVGSRRWNVHKILRMPTRCPYIKASFGKSNPRINNIPNSLIQKKKKCPLSKAITPGWVWIGLTGLILRRNEKKSMYTSLRTLMFLNNLWNHYFGIFAIVLFCPLYIHIFLSPFVRLPKKKKKTKKKFTVNKIILSLILTIWLPSLNWFDRWEN